MKKFDFEYVKKYFEKQKCELLEKEYKNTQEKLEYICSCGNIWKTNFANFKNGQRCRKCKNKKIGEKRKLIIEKVKNFFTVNNCELLEKEYINNSTKMEYICSCGNISHINYNNFKNGRRCSKCAKQKAAEKTRLSWEYVNQYFKDNKCKLLSKYYKNNRTQLQYICENEHKGTTYFKDFQRGKRCKKCAGLEKYTFEYVKQYFQDHNCKLLDKKYINSQTKLQYICQCGKKSSIRFNDFIQGNRCKKCGIKKITGKNNYNYNYNLTDKERIEKRCLPEYPVWRTNIYKTNNYICQKCNQKGGKLNAHHIESWATNKELRFDTNNGITLCRNCHKEFHKKYGIKNNTRQQLNNYLYITNLKDFEKMST